MDGIPEGIREDAFREAAQAAGIPWSEDVQDKFALCESLWKDQVNRKIKAQRDREQHDRKANG